MSAFEKDLFISYAHIDNQPLSAEQEGWITRFHLSLNALLSMRLGKKARIWRDDKLQGNDVFADEIVEQFGRTAVLVSVLTPRYLKSRWCTREITEFCALAESHGGIVVDNKARVFKVLKTPVDSEESLPPMLRSLLGYEFFTMDDGAPLELDALYGEQFAQDYHRKVNKLAFEIAALLKTLELSDTSTVVGDGASMSTPETLSGSATTPVGDGPTDRAADARRVYLAECSFDRKEEREMLQTELLRLGYEVLPDRQLPRDEADYIAAVETALARCELSVHLIGAHPGAVPDGPGGKSVVVLQNELAATCHQTSGLRRVIWLPAGTQSGQASHEAFLCSLQEDADAQCGADLITAGMGSLRCALFSTLEQIERDEREQHDMGGASSSDSAAVQSEKGERDARDDIRTIHILCTNADRKATVPLRRALKARGVEVTLPAFEGAASDVREANRRMLARCDAVLLYYGCGDEAWKRTVDTELRKLPAYRTGGSVPPVHTWLATPSTPDKEDLVDMDESNLIDALDGFDETCLGALLDVEPAESDAA